MPDQNGYFRGTIKKIRILLILNNLSVSNSTIMAL